MFCAKEKPDFEKMWRETQAQFNKMEARALRFEKSAQRLAEALTDIRDACFDTSIGIETNRVGRIYSVAKAAIQIWEGAQK